MTNHCCVTFSLQQYDSTTAYVSVGVLSPVVSAGHWDSWKAHGFPGTAWASSEHGADCRKHSLNTTVELTISSGFLASKITWLCFHCIHRIRTSHRPGKIQGDRNRLHPSVEWVTRNLPLIHSRWVFNLSR